MNEKAELPTTPSAPSEKKVSPPNPPTKGDLMVSILLGVGVLVAVVASIVVVWGKHDDAMGTLKLATGYALLIFLFFLSLALLLEIARGKIDLSELLEELSGGASMSRFQLLTFTMVVAFSFFIVVAGNDTFPDIPTNVLVLLGISAGTYGVSKGLQVGSGDTESSSDKDNASQG